MSETRSLRAGPLTLVFSDGDLRHVRLGGREVLARVYAAVRDRNWGTVGGRIENLKIDAQARHFSVSYDSVHRQGEIDFRWRATITGAESGKIAFSFEGVANSTFLRNRIGFCVHHPLRECAGQWCRVETADGKRSEGRFPDVIAPHQPFLNLRAITHEVEPGVRATVRFHGEVFEMEDHRNWTDANFKTYGTPLALKFPVEVKAGTKIQQMVEITLEGPVRVAAGAAKPAPLEVRVDAKPVGRLPRIGVGLGKAELVEADLEKMRRLRLSHLRVDLAVDREYRPQLQRAMAAARALGVKLEAAVTLPGVLEPLPGAAPFVERWLIYSALEKAASAATVESARQVLGPDAALMAGTNAYFTELNRNRPQGSAWDGVCYSINPQVHAFDDESVMENAAAQADTVRTAKSFAQGKPVIVSPVTLRPRFNPDATGAADPLPPDPRQKQAFCAAWTLASLKALAESGAASVTYFEAAGPGGLFEGAAEYPVYRVLLAGGEFAGAEVTGAVCSDPAKVAALALSAGGRRRLLVANLTAEAQTVHVAGRREALALPPYAVEAV